jgi:hypothetical protein
MVFIAVDSVNHFLYCWENNKLVKLNYNFTLQWEVSLTLPGGLDTNGNNAITVLPSGEILLYSMSRFELRSAVNGTLLKAWANTRTDTTLSNASKVHIMENPNSPNEYGIVIAGLSNAEGNGITQIFKRKFNLA